MSRLAEDRRACTLRRTVVAVLLTLLVVSVGGAVVSNFPADAPLVDPLTWEVVRAPFCHEIQLRGEVESATSTEVRCEVRSSTDGWIRIVEVVEEGTLVQPGDLLVRLDPSLFEHDRNRQEGVCQKAKAAEIAARNAFEAAKTAKREYLEGEYLLARQVAKAELLQANENLRSSQEFLAASRKLALRGFISQQQLSADEFSVVAAEAEVSLAKQKIEVLDNYTKPRRLVELDSALAVGQSQLAAAEYTLRLQREELERIENQIRKCEVRAPVAGPVVLVHLHHHGHSHMIQSGEETHENRALVRLPDPTRMQLKVKIPEEKIGLIRRGQHVHFRLDAFPQIESFGRILRMNEYPEPTEWYSADLKEYLAIVSIDAPFEGMRPGLTADIQVVVEELPNALQVPCHAVWRQGNQDLCIAVDAGKCHAREVELGPSNGETYCILGGLDEGLQIALQPRTVLRSAGLAEVP